MRYCEGPSCNLKATVIAPYSTRLGEKTSAAACGADHAKVVEKRLMLPEALTWSAGQLSDGSASFKEAPEGVPALQPQAFEKALVDLCQRHHVEKFCAVFSDPDRRGEFISRIIKPTSGRDWTSSALQSLAAKAVEMMEGGDLV